MRRGAPALFVLWGVGCIYVDGGNLQARMDLDGDGFSRGMGPGKDCDDLDPEVHPEAEETWYDGIDQNCDGNDTDADGDGHAWVDGVSGDCDDTDPESYPGAMEQLQDDVDQDCDGLVQQDMDDDGYLSNYPGAEDCDDSDEEVHPGAEEICMDGVDNNCDGLAGDCMIQGEIQLTDGADVLIANNLFERTIGQAVHFAGDLNGDGFEDLVFPAPNYNAAIANGEEDNATTDSGGAFVLYGPIDQHVRTANLVAGTSEVDGASLFAPTSVAAGYSVAAPGDVTGDGMPDILVSAVAYNFLQGAVFLVSEAPYGDYDLEADGNAYLLSHGGSFSYYGFWGWKVAGLEDRNGDGLRELLVAAPGLGITLDDWTGSVTEEGCVNEFQLETCGGVDIVYGDPGFSPSEGGPAWQSSANPVATLRGVVPYSATGHEALSVGDVDGNGQEDLLIGAPAGSTLEEGRIGFAYLILNPGASDMDLSDADAVLVGDESLDFFGYAAAHLGDMDGDGLSDFAVGAPGIDLLRGIEQGYVPDSPGATYLFFGTPTSGRAVDASDTRLLGSSNPGMAGAALSAGDMDADGHQDLVIGEREHSTAGLLSGAATVYYGPLSGELIPEEEDAFIVGDGTGTYAGHAVLTGGDLNEDGFHDLIIGASGVEELVQGAAGSLSIFYGGAF